MDYIPQPQLPHGLAEALIRLKSQAGDPWANLAQSLGNSVNQGLQQRRVNQANAPLNQDQQAAMGITSPAPTTGPVQPGQSPLTQRGGGPAFAGGMPRDLATQILQRQTQESIAKETTSRMMGIQGLRNDQADSKVNIPVTDTTKALFKKAGLPIDDGATTVRHEDYEAALKQVLGDKAISGKKDAAAIKAASASTKSDEKTWQSYAKDADISQASSRTLLGTAATVNARADRALETLKSKIVTNEQAAGVAADIAGILKGATPDEQAMREQGYGTLYSRVQAMKQYITGKPKDAVTEDIKIKLRETIADLKKVDNKIIRDHADALPNKYSGLAKSDPERFKKIQESILKKATDETESGNFDDLYKKHGLQ